MISLNEIFKNTIKFNQPLNKALKKPKVINMSISEVKSKDKYTYKFG